MVIITHEKFYFNQLMLTLLFGIWTSELPPPSLQAWQTTEKARPDRVNIYLRRIRDPNNVFSNLRLSFTSVC